LKLTPHQIFVGWITAFCAFVLIGCVALVVSLLQ
jgi:hypothetical protein